MRDVLCVMLVPRVLHMCAVHLVWMCHNYTLCMLRMLQSYATYATFVTYVTYFTYDTYRIYFKIHPIPCREQQHVPSPHIVFHLARNSRPEIHSSMQDYCQNLTLYAEYV